MSTVSHQLQDKQRGVTALQSCVSEQSQQMKDNLRHTQHLKDQLQVADIGRHITSLCMCVCVVQASEQRVLKMAEEVSSLRAALANPPPTLAKQDAILTKFLQPAPKASVAQKACRVHFDRLQEELTTHPRAPAAAAAAAAADARQPMRLIAAYERCRQQTEVGKAPGCLAAWKETCVIIDCLFSSGRSSGGSGCVCGDGAGLPLSHPPVARSGQGRAGRPPHTAGGGHGGQCG